MLVFLLVACGFVVSEAIVCLPNMCERVKCADLSSCNGKVKPNGGFCGCCDSCVQTLAEGQACHMSLFLGVPSQMECDTGLHCSISTGTCVNTVTKRQAQGPCSLRQKQLSQGQSHGLPLLGVQKLRCNVDGSYNPVQCQGSVCYCVNQDGVEINGYRTNVGSSDYATKNCQCARDKAAYEATGLLGQTFTCEANGNYQQYQCRGTVCFCVDDNGKKIGTMTVGIGQLSTLKCSS